SCDRLEELVISSSFGMSRLYYRPSTNVLADVFSKSLKRLDLTKWDITYEVMDEVLKQFPSGLQYLACHSYDFSRSPEKVKKKYADMLQKKDFIVESLRVDSQKEGSRWTRPIYKIVIEFGNNACDKQKLTDKLITN
ncbi:2574_t:CDS:1, partial [Paraglomus occultum]